MGNTLVLRLVGASGRGQHALTVPVFRPSPSPAIAAEKAVQQAYQAPGRYHFTLTLPSSGSSPSPASSSLSAASSAVGAAAAAGEAAASSAAASPAGCSVLGWMPISARRASKSSSSLAPPLPFFFFFLPPAAGHCRWSILTAGCVTQLRACEAELQQLCCCGCSLCKRAV